MDIRVIIPAAGKGTRLGGDIPKVMRLCGGKPLLETVLREVSFVPPEKTYIVVGYKKEYVTSYFGDRYNYVEQKVQRGTGDAVAVCSGAFRDYDGCVLVTFGDMPLFRGSEMRKMCRILEERGADCVLMTAENPDLELWARIVRDTDGNFSRIVEGKDCTPEQAGIRELFSGVLAFDSRALFGLLPELGRNNVQGVDYLTEIPELMVQSNRKVETYMTDDGDDLRGVNTAEDLAACEAVMRRRGMG